MIPSTSFKRARVGHVCDTVLGKMLQTTPKTFGDQEVPYLRAGLLETLSDLAELPTMFAQDSEVRTLGLRKGDLLVAEGGDVGRSEMAPRLPQRTIFQNSLHRIRLRARGDIRFVRYALLSIYSSGWLDVLCNRATFGHLTVEKLRQLHIPWPRPSVQTAIADYLDTETSRIDTLITKKHRIIELLEERRRAELTSAIFADRSTRRGTIRHVVDLLPGYAFPSTSFEDVGIRLLRGVNIAPGRLRWDGEVVHLAPAERQGLSDYELAEGDLVFGMDRPFIGSGVRIAPVTAADLPCLLVQRVARIRATERADPRYIRLLLESDTFVAHLSPITTGVSVPHVSADQILSFRAPLPSYEAQCALARTLERKRDSDATLIDRLVAQIDLLTERYHALITCAVTGGLEVIKPSSGSSRPASSAFMVS